ncbi:hypothetical protein ACOMHN_004712 [Nucella lapillus]
MNYTEDKCWPFEPLPDQEELEKEGRDKYPFGKYDMIFMKVPGVKFDDINNWSRNQPPRKSYITFEQMMAKQEENRQKRQTPKPAISTKAMVGLRKDRGFLVDVNDELIALFRVENQVYAIRDRCPHAGGPLSMGDIEELPALGLCLTCPWHRWQMQLKDGTIYKPCNRQEQAVVYPVNVTTGGDIYIGFDALSEKFFDLDLHPSVDSYAPPSSLEEECSRMPKERRLGYEEARLRQYLEDCKDLCVNGDLHNVSIAWLN